MKRYSIVIVLILGMIASFLNHSMNEVSAFPVDGRVVYPQHCNYEEISQMEHGWQNFYKTGHVFYDDYIALEGNTSLAMQTSNRDGRNIVAASFSFPPQSFEARAFRFFVRVSNWNEVALFSVLMNSNGNWYDMFAVDIKPLFNLPNNEEWIEVVLSRSELYPVNSPTWSSINAIMFRLISVDEKEPTVWVDSLGSFESAKKPLVSIVFDDGMAVTYDNALPVFEEFGVRGTCFVIPDFVGLTADGFMSQEQVDKLANYYGWGIGGHDWRRLTELPKEHSVGDPPWLKTLDEALSGTKAYLDEHKYPGRDCYAIPYGAYNDAIINTISKYFTYIRPHNLLTQPTGYISPNEVNSHLVSCSTTMEQIEEWVQEAKENNDWVVLVMHRIVDSPRAQYCTENSTEFLRQVIDYTMYIAEVDIVPFHEALEVYYPGT